MAYTIVKSDGTVLTTIQDGTINTTSTTLGLPGRNFAGWGQPFDTNFVRLTENFANNNPPANPLRGQLWYNTNNQTLYVCPTDGVTNQASWLAIAATSSGGTTSFGNVTVTGNLSANNITATNNSNANAITTSFLTVTTNANVVEANIATANLTTTRTSNITTGSTSTPGTITGAWTVNGTGNVLTVSGGNLVSTGNIVIPNASSIRDPSGAVITFAGAYNDSNVATFLPNYVGVVGNTAATFRGANLTTGANTTQGNITGNWTLTTGSRLQATYADLAERYEIDLPHSVGTVVKVGGDNEITAATKENDDYVLGVISNSYAFLMNAEAGDNRTHPPVALIGRVPVRIVGSIHKGDKISTNDYGTATKSTSGSGFGYALETNTIEDEKLVLCVIK